MDAEAPQENEKDDVSGYDESKRFHEKNEKKNQRDDDKDVKHTRISKAIQEAGKIKAHLVFTPPKTRNDLQNTAKNKNKG